MFLGELGCYDVNKKRSLKPEYISKKINQWKVQDHEVNEGVSPRKVITRKLLKLYKAAEEFQQFDKIKELARTLDFQGIFITFSKQLEELKVSLLVLFNPAILCVLNIRVIKNKVIMYV